MSDPNSIDLKLIFGSTGIIGALIFFWRLWERRRRIRTEIRAHHLKRWDALVTKANPNPHWEVIATGFEVVVTNIGKEVSIAKVDVTTRPGGSQIARWQPSHESPRLPQLLRPSQSFSHVFLLPTRLKDWHWEHPTVEIHTACGKIFRVSAPEFIRQFNLSLALDPDSFAE